MKKKKWQEFWGKSKDRRDWKMNKLILSLINNFMVEHEDEIVEVVTNPNGELSKQWIEQGNSVKEHLGLMEEMNNENNRKK